jgi:hypothetical protein
MHVASRTDDLGGAKRHLAIDPTHSSASQTAQPATGIHVERARRSPHRVRPPFTRVHLSSSSLSVVHNAICKKSFLPHECSRLACPCDSTILLPTIRKAVQPSHRPFQAYPKWCASPRTPNSTLKEITSYFEFEPATRCLLRYQPDSQCSFTTSHATARQCVRYEVASS